MGKLKKHQAVAIILILVAASIGCVKQQETSTTNNTTLEKASLDQDIETYSKALEELDELLRELEEKESKVEFTGEETIE